jgi:hypothetical protein
LAAHFDRGPEWRVNQFHTPEQQLMATKLNILTYLQQAKGLAELAQRCAPPHSLGQLTLRPPAPQKAARRGLRLPIDIQNPEDAPYPVTIVHVRVPARVPPLSV